MMISTRRKMSFTNSFTGCLLLLLCTLLVHARISPYRGGKKNALPEGYKYQTLYFDQKLDHFGFANDSTFKQRYLVSDQFWNHNGGPIFFYTGNEGDIAWFCNNTGFMWDIAPRFKALLVFAEHRYYGESLPFGSASYKGPSQLNFLTSEQALADFATLVGHLKATVPGAAKSKVMAFGGSYGGMLSAWARMKYPNVFDGALAASAPIWLFDGLRPCDSAFVTITKTFSKASPGCPDNIALSWETLDQFGKTAEGLRFLSSTFQLCSPLKSAGDVGVLKGWLSEIWFNLAMVDYPYPANFLEPLPAWPVKAVCEYLKAPLSGKALVMGLAKAVNVYNNYTGMAPCVNLSQSATGNLGDAGWGYQACTEMVMASCSGKGSMFEPSEWDFEKFSDGCYNAYKVRPRKDWGITQYWGTSIQTASNIIFSNGLLDPWSSLGVLDMLGDSLIAIWIRDGAHHLDLRAADPADPYDLKAARTQEVNLINLWLNDD